MAERDTSHQDPEVFEKTLQELMAQGVDRRIAEGRARRAAAIAYRKVHGEPERPPRPAAAAAGDGGGDGERAPAAAPTSTGSWPWSRPKASSGSNVSRATGSTCSPTCSRRSWSACSS